MTNPWGVTKAEAECMDLYLKLNSGKRVADVRGCSLSNVQALMDSARDRIRLTAPAHLRGTMHCALQWNAWRRENPSSKWSGL